MDETICPFCKQESNEYIRYKREVPADRKEIIDADKESMIMLYPCSHAFPLSIYKQYIDKSNKIREYVNEYVTAKGKNSRNQVYEKYHEDIVEHNEIVERCIGNVEKTQP